MKILKKLAVIISSAILFNLSSVTASADANTLNIKVYMANNECRVYGVPGAFNRFSLIKGKVYGFYYVATGIKVNLYFTPGNEHIRTTLLETCYNQYKTYWNLSGEAFELMDVHCAHDSDQNCINGNISNPSIMHHTNVYNLMLQLPRPSTNYAVMLLTPQVMCQQDNRLGHVAFNGVGFSTLDFVAVRDRDYIVEDYTDYRYTFYGAEGMVHEIGHLYNVVDHYDENLGSERDNCIWGANHDTQSVIESLTVCSVCLNTIKNNKNKYNHTPLE